MRSAPKTVIRSSREAKVSAIANLLRGLPGLPPTVHAVRRLRATIIDRALNITTVPRIDPDPSLAAATSLGDATEYQVVDYILMRRYMQPVCIAQDDVLMDIGCGMGRVLCVFARARLKTPARLKKCIGIEFSGELAGIAERNARALRGRRAPIEIRIGDATEADYTEGTIFWFYNPFGERTMRAVLARLHRSLYLSPRRIQIVYVNPVCEAVLEQSPWLRCTCVKNFPSFRSGAEGAKVSYWTNA